MERNHITLEDTEIRERLTKKGGYKPMKLNT